MSDEVKSGQISFDSPSGAPDSAMKPIILKLKKGGKKAKKKAGVEGDERKPKYTRGLKKLQKFEGKMVSIARKATRAVSKGMDTYDREREQSAREKTDGAIEDFIHNTAKASSAALKEAADIPVDVAEAIGPVSFYKGLRRTVRRTAKSLRLWRI